MACGWQTPAQGNDLDEQQTPVVQGSKDRVTVVGMAPHAAVWAGRTHEMSSTVEQ